MKIWMLILGCVATLLGCRAEDETRRGEVNEFCNGAADDCRAGLVCEDGLCADHTGETEFSCGDFCANLAACGAAEDTCVADCRVTIRSWGFEAQDDFTRCGATLTCDEIATIDFVPQECYTRIPVATERQQRCELFNDVAISCSSDAVAQLSTACTGLARVSDEETWASTERCVNAANVGICSGIATCLNEVFSLNPPLVFADDDGPQPVPAEDQR
jgi:hypothetical protein